MEVMRERPCGCYNTSCRTSQKPLFPIGRVPQTMMTPTLNKNSSHIFQIVEPMLTTYAIDDVIAEAEAEITNFKQPEYMSVVRSSEVIREKALCCGHVHGDASSKRVFKERMHESVSFSMKNYSGACNDVTLRSLAQCATCLVELQERDNSATTSSGKGRYDKCKSKTAAR